MTDVSSPTRLRGLFVTHSVGMYGGERSLALLLGALPNTDVTVLVPRAWPHRPPNDLDALRANFFPRASRVLECYLPRSLCYDGRPEDGRGRALAAGRELLWQTERHRFERLLDEGGFDFMHLNSLVLHQLVRRRLPSFQHVREIALELGARSQEKLAAAAGLVFIDGATRRALPEAPGQPATTLNNPVDMRGVGELDVAAEKARLGVDEHSVVFSVIGSVIPIKGVDFLLEVFAQVASPRARLLVVGKAKGPHGEEIAALAQADPRVTLVGEEPQVERIYAVSDYVLRGDPRFAIGRTIFEGLLSDCDVIIPGSPDLAAQESELMERRDKVHLYPVRDSAALQDLLTKLVERPVVRKRFTSSTEVYGARFESFIRGVLGARLAPS